MGRDVQDETEEAARGTFLEGEVLRFYLKGDGCEANDGSQAEERHGT